MTNTTQESCFNDTVNLLYSRLIALKRQYAHQDGRRILVALAGVPGSGKSTISAALAEMYRLSGNNDLAIIPMDGFHFPKSTLNAFDNPQKAFAQRGAPFTFDAHSFIKLVKALKGSRVTLSDEPQFAIQAPSFDHAAKDPVENDIYISSADRVIILEGNYLLLGESPWDEIEKLVDEKWFVDVPESVAKQRLIDRHIQAGIESTREAAEIRVEGNDLRNGRLIRDKLILPDIVIQN